MNFCAEESYNDLKDELYEQIYSFNVDIME